MKEKKRVLIDASTVTSQIDGLSIYIVNLIRHIPDEAFKEFEFDILKNPGFSRDDLDFVLESGKFNVIERKIAPIGPMRDWDMFWFLKKNKKRYNLIHITSNQYPLSLKNGIGTIHDITFKTYFDNPKYTFNLATWYMDKVIKNCIKRSSQIIAVSGSTRNELIRQYQLNEQSGRKINVIYEGWEHLTYDKDELCTESRNLTNYLFYLGTARKHKNIRNLLLGFKIAMGNLSKSTKLVLAGSDKYISGDDRKLIDEINATGERVIVTGYMTGACIKKLFRNADAFIFPSLSEGFGLPVLEAFYHNIPVLCSNCTSLPEVAGDAALYFNPFEPASIAEKICQFYRHPEMRNKLVTAGQQRIFKFSWNDVAAQTIEVYKNILNTKG